MMVHTNAAMVRTDSKVIPAVAPAAAGEALRSQLFAAARQTIQRSVQLMGHASEAIARMTVAGRGEQAMRQIAPAKACQSIVVQLRLLDGQVITQPMVCSAPRLYRAACQPLLP